MRKCLWLAVVTRFVLSRLERLLHYSHWHTSVCSAFRKPKELAERAEMTRHSADTKPFTFSRDRVPKGIATNFAFIPRRATTTSSSILRWCFPVPACRGCHPFYSLVRLWDMPKNITILLRIYHIHIIVRNFIVIVAVIVYCIAITILAMVNRFCSTYGTRLLHRADDSFTRVPFSRDRRFVSKFRATLLSCAELATSLIFLATCPTSCRSRKFHRDKFSRTLTRHGSVFLE